MNEFTYETDFPRCFQPPHVEYDSFWSELHWLIQIPMVRQIVPGRAEISRKVKTDSG
jgi:hypothetical protein